MAAIANPIKEADIAQTRLEALTQHLKPNEKAALDQRIASIAEADQKVIDLVANLSSEKAFLNESIWDPEMYEEIQMVSFKALFDKKISLEQFVTCSLVSYAFEQFQARFLRVTIDPEAHLPKHLQKLTKEQQQTVSNEPQKLDSKFSVIKASDELTSAMINDFIKKSYPDYAQSDTLFNDLKQAFHEKIAEIPASERLFFSYEMPIKDIREVSPMLNGLINIVRMPFIKLEQVTENSTKFLFPSYSLVCALLNASNPEGIKLVPVFGKLSTKDIREYLRRGKVAINLKLPMAELFKNGQPTQWADGQASGPIPFTFHDVYHAWVKKNLTQAQLKKTKGMIDVLVNFRKELVLIRDGKKDMSDDIKIVLSKYFKYCDKKATEAIKQLGKDIWELSDMGISNMSPTSSSNIKILFEHLSRFAQDYIEQNTAKAGIDYFNDLM